MRTLLFALILVPLLLSCNAYSPLNSTSSIEDRLEEAQKCLRDSDYGCAITHYNALPDGKLKSEKLCMVHLAKGGVTLTTLINTVNKNNSKVLGNFAQTLMPWSSTKSADLDTAKTQCTNFAADGTSGNQGILLRTLSLMAHCSIRMAKTDQFLGNAETDTTCTTAGNASGTVTTGDIGPVNGIIGSGTNGMCAADVTSCVGDISALSASALTTAGLTDLKGALDSIPAALKDATSATAAIRIAIQSTI